MATSPEVYVDTSAFIAFTDGSDTHHPLFARLFATPPRLVTTSLVIAEGHGWFLRRFDRTRALGFLALVEMLVTHVRSELQETAVAVLSLFDTHRRIRHVWPNKQHKVHTLLLHLKTPEHVHGQFLLE